MIAYQIYRFANYRPPSYQEAIQQAIRRYAKTWHRLPTAIIVGPERLPEAQDAMQQINADLIKAKVTGLDIPILVVGGCIWWEVGLGLQGENYDRSRESNRTGQPMA